MDDEGKDEVTYLDARRHKEKAPYRWLNDLRVRRAGKPLVKQTIAFLLEELEVDPDTLQLGAAGHAIFRFEYSLITENNLTHNEYIEAVTERMMKIIGMPAAFVVIRGVKNDTSHTMASLIYII